MKEQEQYGKCAVCGSGAFACLDRNDRKKNPSEFESQTIQCCGCQECFLYVRHGGRSTQIHLRQFLQRPADRPGKQPLDKYSLAEDLFNAAILDWLPREETCLQFGLQTPQHLLAAKWLIYEGAGPYELCRVLGDGKAMTRLFRFACGESEFPGLSFRIPYDLFHEAVESSDA